MDILYTDQLKRISDKLKELTVTFNLLSREVEKSTESANELFTSIAEHIKAREYIQKAAQLTQSGLEKHLSEIVTKALDIVFEEEAPKFITRFVIKRNASECEMFFTDNGINEMDPLDSCGFGAVDVASFALRIAVWALSKTRNTLIVDEPFRNLDSERMPRASLMLKILSEELGIQMVVVTHEEDLAECGDKVFIVSKKLNGSSIDERK